MRIRLDPWPVDTLDGQLTLKAFAGLVYDAETPQWAAIAPKPIPQRLRRVLTIDGKPRMEARLLLEDDSRALSVAGFGAFVAGAVDLCPHGSRAAELQEVKAQRFLAYSQDWGETVQPARFSPRNPQTGDLLYAPLPFSGQQLEGPKAAIQRQMMQAEDELARAVASELPLDDTDYDGLPETLVLKDGRVDPGRGGRAIVGCIKTLHTDYLGHDRIGLLSDLKVGERTPILRFNLSEKSREQRFTWYVRLAQAPFYQHPLAGIMRLEMHAPEDSDFVPKGVLDIAQLSGTLLTRLASSPYKDARAPQNLIPTAALEQAMSRAMGNLELVTRRIYAHIAQQSL